MKVKIAATQMSCDWEIENNLNKAIKLSLTFLCLGVVVQLLIDDDLLNWDPIGNIQDLSLIHISEPTRPY